MGTSVDLVSVRLGMPEPTRVLWLTKGLALGGQERLLEFLARAHDDQDFRIECAYAVPGLDHQVGPLEAAGVPCSCLGTPGRSWSWVVSLWGLLGADRFDVVHVHSPLLAAVVRPMVRLRRRVRRSARPVLMTTDHLEWSGYHPLTRWANRLTAPLDDVPIAVSEAVRQSMAGRTRARAVVMVQGIDVADLRRRFAGSDDTAEEPAGGDLVVCTVANLRAQKDYGTLLHAARLVVDRRDHVRFVAVGDDAGPYGDEMHELCRGLGLDDRVEFTGLRDDAVAVMASSDIFVVASAFEAGPITAMEAAALGRPIVSTAVGIMLDVFADGRDCLRVPVGDAPALAAALTRVVDDPTLRVTLGAGARRLADHRFDITRVVGALQDLYRDRVLAADAKARRGDSPKSANR